MRIVRVRVTQTFSLYSSRELVALNSKWDDEETIGRQFMFMFDTCENVFFVWGQHEMMKTFRTEQANSCILLGSNSWTLRVLLNLKPEMILRITFVVLDYPWIPQRDHEHSINVLLDCGSQVTQSTDFTELVNNETWLSSSRLVVKPDMLFGKRGKSGLVALNLDMAQVAQFVKERLGVEVI